MGTHRFGTSRHPTMLLASLLLLESLLLPVPFLSWHPCCGDFTAVAGVPSVATIYAVVGLLPAVIVSLRPCCCRFSAVPCALVVDSVFAADNTVYATKIGRCKTINCILPGSCSLLQFFSVYLYVSHAAACVISLL